MNRVFQVQPTKQLMANSSTKDTISARSKIDKSHLMQLNDADEGITKLLHGYGCQVLCLKMVTNKLDDRTSPVKPNSITYDISENGKASSHQDARFFQNCLPYSSLKIIAKFLLST